MLELKHVVAWPARIDPDEQIIPPHLKLAILSRGRIALPAAQMTPFLDEARAAGSTWPDRLRGDLSQLSPIFPVTVELFLRRRYPMSYEAIRESLAAYLTIRHGKELSPECYLMVFTIPGDVQEFEKGLGLRMDRLFDRARVSRRAYAREGRWVVLAYACFPPALTRFVRPVERPGTGPPPALPSPMPPLRTCWERGRRAYVTDVADVVSVSAWRLLPHARTPPT